MKIKAFLSLIVAGLLFFQSNSHAQSTNSDDAATRAALQAMSKSIQAKAHAGKHDEADYTNELNQLDALIASKKDAKTDEAVQYTYMKAVLYLEVIRDVDKGAAIMRQIVMSYPNTQYSASAVKVIAKVPEMKEQLKEAEQAEQTQKMLAPGLAFPDFDTTNIDGQPISVASLKGKVVMIDFWATWCGPCRAELPNVIEVYKKHHSQGFEIIGVSLDSDRAKLTAFLKAQDGLTWPQYFDGGGWQNKLAAKYGVESIPFTILVGPDGKIIDKDLRGDDLEDAVAKAVAAK